MEKKKKISFFFYRKKDISEVSGFPPLELKNKLTKGIYFLMCNFYVCTYQMLKKELIDFFKRNRYICMEKD